MAIAMLTRLARQASVPVYCLENGGERKCRYLHLDRRLRLVPSPVQAAILLVAGPVPQAMAGAALNVHDRIPAPRGVMLWRKEEAENELFSGDGIRICRSHDPVDDIVALYQALLDDQEPESALRGVSDNPVEWQGKGDHGQGGKGMMGGTPYGRPMGMTGEDLRDGLNLGSTMTSMGPYLPWMPPGLRLHVTLQGDVIQELDIMAAPGVAHDMADIFLRAHTEPVPIAELELARARHHLQVIADMLFLQEMDVLGRRALMIARQLVPGHHTSIRRLQAAVKRSGFFFWSGRGIGNLAGADLTGCGAAARASGLHQDCRNQDPAYAALDFTILSRTGGDVAAIINQRFDEAVQAVELAGKAEERWREPGPPLEGPRGALPLTREFKVRDSLTDQAPGMAWDSFVTLLVSLDLDAAALPGDEEFDQAFYQQAQDEEEEE